MTASGDEDSGVILGVGRKSGKGGNEADTEADVPHALPVGCNGVDVSGNEAVTEADAPDALPVGGLGAGVPVAAGLTAQSMGSTGGPLVEGLACRLLSSMLALSLG